ncbi:hypothetical protein HNR59_002702 [Aquamicrobium lusatiense]|uniref:DUF4169 family protein n=1 Tax=Aquamicrobium lusatiense TaxID=89772 RepID=A0A7W9S3F2_9HYPH|nr:DUF4169 family protein [Aquamicrobium lusatiense]MBB6013357.1 hypothetical protein [Aquamicrobium lusatiense]
MGEIVNLRQIRKRKARDDKELAAAQNRALHGRTKSERERDRKAEEKSRTLLDGHFLKPVRPSEED